MISAHVDNSDLNGINLARNYLTLTHRLFADDNMIFMNAKYRNYKMLKKILEDYYAASGQQVNMEKSNLFFPANTLDHVRDGVTDILNISNAEDPGKYLGLPILWGRLKDAALAYVRDKITTRRRPDKLVWVVAKDGQYSVKLGYVAATRPNIGVDIYRPGSSRSRLMDGSVWKVVWNLKVMLKVKHFMWRLMNNALATREALAKRCAPNEFCPFCGEEVETTEHVFLLCNWVRVAWFSCSLGLLINYMEVCDMNCWFGALLLDEFKNNDYGKAYLIIFCWFIWKMRCRSVFKNINPDPAATIDLTNACVSEFWGVKELTKSAPVMPEYVNEVKWQKPLPGCIIVKMNCDGAFDARTDKAESMQADSAFFVELLTVKKAVLLSDLWEGIPITIETDCVDVFNAVQWRKYSACPWKYHEVLSDVLELIVDRRLISVSLISRKRNYAADYLAALASSELGPQGLVSAPPSPLALIILQEATMNSTLDND
ncbi:uncharacterized protein LOC129309003 [Prosopis cineraria]|uniref:uncharacterized protein LOC129309003 n=1 Tax=Prosopis cineraria TaxID=364024 RepID=UPI00240ED129|nr:uncharacterized protein LOC129309003 [Prosopis cineraria]